MMPRLHLVELEDLEWFPAILRDGVTDFLQFTITASDTYAPVAPLLAEVLRETGATQVVDLCSGGGGPWLRLQPALAAEGADYTVLLTDRHPNTAALADAPAEVVRAGALSYYPHPVDACAVPPELSGVRTLFTALHHFPPDAVVTLLGDAVRRGAPIAAFEATQRTVTSLLITLLSPMVVLLVTPFIRPFRWSRLAWTYLLPLIPLTVLWDGLVSCLRSYTVDEIRTLVSRVPAADTYAWHIGTLPGAGPAVITYLVGVPAGRA